MAVDEVQWYIRWYDPAETHYVPALRVGGSFYISKALWWRGVWLPFALSELISSELQWSLFFFSSLWKSSQLLSSLTEKKAHIHTLSNSSCPITAVNPADTSSVRHKPSRPPADGPLADWEKAGKHISPSLAVKFKHTSDLLWLILHSFKRCRVASVVESLINSGLPQLYNVTLHVGSLPELSIGCLQKHNVTQYVLHQLSAENTQKHKAAPGAVSAVLVTYLLGNKACDERWRWWWWWWVRSLSEVLSRTFPAISASNELCLFRWSETSWAAIQ